MDETRPDDQKAGEGAQAHVPDSFGTADVAVVAAFLGLAGLPLLHVIGPLILLPFLTISVGKLVWPVLRWATSRVSGSAAVNGGEQ